MSDDVDPVEPRRPESTSTVLARLEGLIRLVDLKIDQGAKETSSNTKRLDAHDRDLESIRLAMQRLGDEAKAREAASAAALLAVKEARATERETDEKRWTPKARFWTTALSLASVVSAIVTVLALTHHL